MNNQAMLKLPAAIANSEKEINSANFATQEGNHGKARTCMRRAVGFITDIYLIENPKPEYGKSFMNNIRGIEGDETLPKEVREAASILIKKGTFDEVKGDEAIGQGLLVIKYFKKLLNIL